jgi:secondary thiamine-phosphate synthase enzyme
VIQLQIRTSGKQTFEDITSQVQEAVGESTVQEGLCYLFCPHTTAGLTLNENWDPSVQHDMGLVLDDLVPQRDEFRHSSSRQIITDGRITDAICLRGTTDAGELAGRLPG